MLLEWKQFRIDLESFHNLVKTIPNTDGIVANEQRFEIVETSPLDETSVNTIINYYNALTEEGELEKIQFRENIPNVLLNCKNALLSKNYDDMSELERKVLLNLTLTNNELEELSNLYS